MFKKFGLFFLGFLVIFLYRNWFTAQSLGSGDWPYLYIENIKEFSFYPKPHFLWLGVYYQIPTKILVEYFHIPWETTEKLLWFWPFLILSVYSSYYLTRSWIGVVIYLTNTYILMVVGGGQMGVAMAYALAPLALKLILDLFSAEKLSIIVLVLSSVVFGVFTMFDPRIAYVLGIGIFLYAIFFAAFSVRIFIYTIVIGLITGLVNSFWIVPLFLGTSKIPFENFNSLAGFTFLSFADFSQAFSLLHPNWPENIFGKVSFIHPEFLVIPIVAFSSLLFIGNKEKSRELYRKVIFFVLLGILGAFLAKGARQPFGEINQWLFGNVPGMNMFRDATKFYLLTALSYSVLIPYALSSITHHVQKMYIKKKTFIGAIFPIIFIIFWVFIVREAIAEQLGGTFKAHNVPQEYIQLKEFLVSDNIYYQTLWIPQKERFGFASKTHPAISGQDFFHISDPVEIVKKLTEKKSYEMLKSQRVRYIILPSDPQGELFLEERKYSDVVRNNVEKTLSTIPFLSIEKKFNTIILYRLY